MTGGWITQAGRAWWQLQAARELASVLAGCGDLPLVTWTVAAGGAVLAAWREAPGLEGCREWPGGHGTVRMHASGRREGGVLVRVSAGFFEEQR